MWWKTGKQQAIVLINFYDNA